MAWASKPMLAALGGTACAGGEAGSAFFFLRNCQTATATAAMTRARRMMDSVLMGQHFLGLRPLSKLV